MKYYKLIFIFLGVFATLLAQDTIPSSSANSAASPTTPILATGNSSVILVGECYNQTFNGKGNLQLTVRRDSKNQLSGYMLITGDLFGSGKLTGTIDGDSVKISSHAPDTQVTINWQGTLKDGTITGTYIVPAMPPTPKGLITPLQNGTWTVKVLSDESLEEYGKREINFKTDFLNNIMLEIQDKLELDHELSGLNPAK